LPLLVVVLLTLVVVKSTPPLSPPPLRVPEIDLATNRRANDKADCDEDGCIFYLSVASTKSLFCLFCEKTEEEKSRARLKSATRNALFSARSPEPLSVVPLSLSQSLLFSADLSWVLYVWGKTTQQTQHRGREKAE
tara:strand:- start:235 stop:642 length:408 start_codon:yes stop_codon:yes gene_type:complete